MSRIRKAAASGTTAVLLLVVLASPALAGGTAPPGVGDKLNTLISWATWVGGIAGVLGFLGVGIVAAIQHRRGTAGEHVGAFAGVCLACAVVAAAPQLAAAMT